MAKDKKEQKIITNIEEFFEQISEEENSDRMQQWLEFQRKIPGRSAFNNMLVYIQKPNCQYWAGKYEWKSIFNRIVKPSARPILVLYPFGPVDFVYDYSDLEPSDNPNDIDIDKYMNGENEELKFDYNKFENLKNLAAKIDLNIEIPPQDNINAAKILRRAQGVAFIVNYDLNEKTKRRIMLSAKYNDPKYLLEAFGVLIHEVAHHLLGHLGEIESYIDVKEKGKQVRKKVVLAKHRAVDKNTKEIEAELTAWLVFAKYGFGKNSAPYMAGWITKEAKSNAKIVEVMKATERIYQMCEGKKWWIDLAKRQKFNIVSQT